MLCLQNMNRLLGYSILLFSFQVHAGEDRLLCQSRELFIEPDMQMEETIFDFASANEAKKALGKLDPNSKDLMTQFAIQNNSRIVRGYKLKTKALETGTDQDIKLFCDFYVSESYYHD